MFTLPPKLQRLLPLAFWAAASFALVMALLPKPPQLPGAPGDKVQHMIAFATLAALAALAWPRTGLIRIALWLSLFGAAIEILQLIPALHRDGSWLDWVADSAAIAAVLLLFAVGRRSWAARRF